MDQRPLIRVACAGSVDDGKSTLIGRLLHDTDSLLEDQAQAVAEASRKSGEEGINLALLTDGLKDEREQKITIDVAYRHFSTPRRRFLLADTPGHAQYTRNMVTGCSTAEIVIVLLDAFRGPTEQTWRHLFLCSLVRAPHIALVVNKMDLVDWSQERFQEVCEEVRQFCRPLGLSHLRFFPMSALTGEGLARRSEATWRTGECLLEWLDEVEIFPSRGLVDFRLPVQCVLRPDAGYRGYAGRVASGRIRVGEEVGIYPGGQITRVKSLLVNGDTQGEAEAGDAVALELSDDVDAGRGCIISRPRNSPTLASRLEAVCCWMGDSPGAKGGSFRFRHGSSDSPCLLTEVPYRLALPGLHREPTQRLEKNEIARIVIDLASPHPLDLYEHNREMGCFVLLDPETGEVAAAGTITRLLQEPGSQSASAPSSRGKVFWLTGLSGAGKTTIAQAVAEVLRRKGEAVAVLDGDDLRGGLCSDLGFTQEDRAENVRRTAEIAKVLSSQGITVICSLISPLEAQRQTARDILGANMTLVHVHCPWEELVRRDVKGLYAKAAAGELSHFTGVSSEYEEPVSPDLRLDTSQVSLADAVQEVLRT